MHIHPYAYICRQTYADIPNTIECENLGRITLFHVHSRVCTSMYVCMCVCMYVCMYVCMNILGGLRCSMCIPESVHLCMYVCMYVCVYMYACISWEDYVVPRPFQSLYIYVCMYVCISWVACIVP